MVLFSSASVCRSACPFVEALKNREEIDVAWLDKNISYGDS